MTRKTRTGKKARRPGKPGKKPAATKRAPEAKPVPKTGYDAYKKCPGCGHTHWDLPAECWGETGPVCEYCVEDSRQERLRVSDADDYLYD
jgi:hypothetical protein